MIALILKIYKALHDSLLKHSSKIQTLYLGLLGNKAIAKEDKVANGGDSIDNVTRQSSLE